jgi:dipeptidyl aminopeptidase/acylaminoacyl peptidase
MPRADLQSEYRAAAYLSIFQQTNWLVPATRRYWLKAIEIFQSNWCGSRDKLRYWSMGIGTVIVCLTHSVAESATTPVKHSVTLEDAYALVSVGAINISPDDKRLAVEVGDEIKIFDLNADSSPTPIKVLRGRAPAWSPNSKLLAYFVGTDDGQQLAVWNSKGDTVEQVTSMEGGVMPNPFASYDACAQMSVSWAPDSKKVVFATRIAKAKRPASSAQQKNAGIRVYGKDTPLRPSLVDGVFKEANFWDARFGRSKLADALKESDAYPELGHNRIVIVNLDTKKTSELSGSAAQYSCPSWAPDGSSIAAIADITEKRPSMYTGGPEYVARSTLSIFDLPDWKERQLSVPAARVGKPDWSKDARRLAVVAQRNPLIGSFSRILTYSKLSGEYVWVQTPQDLAAMEVKWSKDGTSILAKLADRFGYTLWKLGVETGFSKQIATFGWHVGPQFESYAEYRNRACIFAAESSWFKGRLIVTSIASKTPRTIYDANPQIEKLELGEQRRITWRGRSGDEVDGILILPPHYQVGRRYPMIVNGYPRAAWDSFRLTSQYEETGQLQAARGYIVFRPALRAPHGGYWYTRGESYTDKARGVAGIPIMIDDFESGVEYLIAAGMADPDRIGIFGHSNGGWVANMLIARTSIAKAAVIESGISNAITMSFFPFPMLTRGTDPATNGNVFDNLSDYIELSPIFKIREVQIPVLLIVGDQDWQWVPQMIAEYGALREEGKDVELIRYADEGHVMRSHSSITDAFNRVNSFFDEKLMVRTVHLE